MSGRGPSWSASSRVRRSSPFTHSGVTSPTTSLGCSSEGRICGGRFRQSLGRTGTPSASMRSSSLPLYPRPPKFLGVGLNSPDHIAELKSDAPSQELTKTIAAMAHLREAFPDPRIPTVFNCVTGTSARSRSRASAPSTTRWSESRHRMGSSQRRAQKSPSSRPDHRARSVESAARWASRV
jgi:hypothetical protein